MSNRSVFWMNGDKPSYVSNRARVLSALVVCCCTSMRSLLHGLKNDWFAGFEARSMRRSAAPSQISNPLKRARFQPPLIAGDAAASTSSVGFVFHTCTCIASRGHLQNICIKCESGKCMFEKENWNDEVLLLIRLLFKSKCRSRTYQCSVKGIAVIE